MAGDAFREWYGRFRRTGDICPIRLGMTRDEIRASLGEPDDVGGITRKHKLPSIWKYCALEFCFEHGREGRLILICMENGRGGHEVMIGGSLPDCP